MKSGTPRFLNVPNAMETSVFDGFNFLFLGAYVQPVCTRKPQLGQFLNRILGALCTRAAHVQPKMHPVSLIFPGITPFGCIFAADWLHSAANRLHSAAIWMHSAAV